MTAAIQPGTQPSSVVLKQQKLERIEAIVADGVRMRKDDNVSALKLPEMLTKKHGQDFTENSVAILGQIDKRYGNTKAQGASQRAQERKDRNRTLRFDESTIQSLANPDNKKDDTKAPATGAKDGKASPPPAGDAKNNSTTAPKDPGSAHSSTASSPATSPKPQQHPKAPDPQASQSKDDDDTSETPSQATSPQNQQPPQGKQPPAPPKIGNGTSPVDPANSSNHTSPIHRKPPATPLQIPHFTPKKATWRDSVANFFSMIIFWIVNLCSSDKRQAKELVKGLDKITTAAATPKKDASESDGKCIARRKKLVMEAIDSLHLPRDARQRLHKDFATNPTKSLTIAGMIFRNAPAILALKELLDDSHAKGAKVDAAYKALQAVMGTSFKLTTLAPLDGNPKALTAKMRKAALEELDDTCGIPKHVVEGTKLAAGKHPKMLPLSFGNIVSTIQHNGFSY